MSSENDFLSFLSETEDFQPLNFASDCDALNFANASPPQQPVTYAPSDVFLTNPEISPSSLNNVAVYPQFTSAQPFQFQAAAQAFAFPYVAVPQVVGFPVTGLAAPAVTVVSPSYSTATSSSSASSASSSPTPTTSSPKRKPKEKADKVRKVKEDDSDDKPKKRRKRLDDEIEHDKSMLQALLSKPNNALTKEEKEKKRVLRNRQSAQKSREKKRQESEVLSVENDKLRSENDELKKRVSELELEVVTLKGKLLEYGYTETDAISAAPPRPLALLFDEAPKAVALFVVLFCVGLFVFSGMGTKGDRGNSAIPSPIDGDLIVKSEMKHGRTILNTTENQDDITIVYNSEEEQKTYFKESKTKYGLSNSDNTKFTDTEELSMEVNFDDMEKTKFYYPKEMKKHFTFSHQKKDNKQQQQQPFGEDVNETEPTTIEVPEQAANETTVETAEKEPHILFNATSDSSDTNLNETMMAGAGQLITVKDKTTVDMTNFEKGYLYHISTEEDATTGKKTIFFFCPFSYPLLPPPSEDGTENPAQDVSIKIYIPDKSVHNTNDKFSKVLRVAEITAEKLSLHEAFFAFPNEFRVKKPKNGTASAA